MEPKSWRPIKHKKPQYILRNWYRIDDPIICGGVSKGPYFAYRKEIFYRKNAMDSANSQQDLMVWNFGLAVVGLCYSLPKFMYVHDFLAFPFLFSLTVTFCGHWLHFLSGWEYLSLYYYSLNSCSDVHFIT